MPGTQRPKMAMIEGGQFGLTHPLHEGEHGSVHESNVQICVTIAKVPNTPMVLELDGLDAIGPAKDVVEERDKNARMQAGVNPVIDLDQDRSRDDQDLRGALDELPTARVIGIAAVERRIQGARVQDQRHERGSIRSSPARRAVSL